MPVPITQTAASIDLSQRAGVTTTVAASPAAAAETIIASLTMNADEVVRTGAILTGFAAFTVGTSGTAVRLRIRKTDVAGTVIGDTGALTGGVAATNLLAENVAGFDATPTAGSQVYVLTLQVTGGAAASTVSAVELAAIVI